VSGRPLERFEVVHITELELDSLLIKKVLHGIAIVIDESVENMDTSADCQQCRNQDTPDISCPAHDEDVPTA
jgi:hypothetical protein